SSRMSNICKGPTALPPSAVPPCPRLEQLLFECSGLGLGAKRRRTGATAFGPTSAHHNTLQTFPFVRRREALDRVRQKERPERKRRKLDRLAKAIRCSVVPLTALAREKGAKHDCCNGCQSRERRLRDLRRCRRRDNGCGRRAGHERNEGDVEVGEVLDVGDRLVRPVCRCSGSAELERRAVFGTDVLKGGGDRHGAAGPSRR